MGLMRTYQRATAGRSPRARTKFRCVIIKIGADFGFWKAALRITPHFLGQIGRLARTGASVALYPRVVAQSEAFFRRRGALAVFFARFVPPIRAFVPITAGALGMPPLRFYAVNLPAVLLWAPAHVLPGVLAVSALHQYAGIPHHTGTGKHYWMLAVIGGALIVALALWMIRRRRGRGAIEPTAEQIRKDLR